MNKTDRTERIALLHVRLVEVEVEMFRALADMPIKFRNVLLPACEPLLAEAIAIAVAMKLGTSLAPDSVTDIDKRTRVLLESLVHLLELALRMKALSEGRVAIILERIQALKKRLA